MAFRRFWHTGASFSERGSSWGWNINHTAPFPSWIKGENLLPWKDVVVNGDTNGYETPHAWGPPSFSA